MIYKGFKSGIVSKDEQTNIFTGVVENASDYVKFKSDTISGIENKFHEAVDKYIVDCELIGKDPMIKQNNNRSLGY